MVLCEVCLLIGKSKIYVVGGMTTTTETAAFKKNGFCVLKAKELEAELFICTMSF